MAETIEAPAFSTVGAIPVGLFTVCLNPEFTIHPGEVFEVAAEVTRIPYLFKEGETWKYSVGWDTYHSIGHVQTFEEAIEKALEDLHRFRDNWSLRGDTVSKITLFKYPEA